MADSPLIHRPARNYVVCLRICTFLLKGRWVRTPRYIDLLKVAGPALGWHNDQGYAGRMRPDSPAKSSGVRVHPARMCSHRYQRSNDAGMVPESGWRGFSRQYSP